MLVSRSAAQSSVSPTAVSSRRVKIASSIAMPRSPDFRLICFISASIRAAHVLTAGQLGTIRDPDGRDQRYGRIQSGLQIFIWGLNEQLNSHSVYVGERWIVGGAACDSVVHVRRIWDWSCAAI